MLYYTYNIRLDTGALISGWELSGLGLCKAENKKLQKVITKPKKCLKKQIQMQKCV